jgi:hypothetical protein
MVLFIISRRQGGEGLANVLLTMPLANSWNPIFPPPNQRGLPQHFNERGWGGGLGRTVQRHIKNTVRCGGVEWRGVAVGAVQEVYRAYSTVVLQYCTYTGGSVLKVKSTILV